MKKLTTTLLALTISATSTFTHTANAESRISLVSKYQTNERICSSLRESESYQPFLLAELTYDFMKTRGALLELKLLERSSQMEVPEYTFNFPGIGSGKAGESLDLRQYASGAARGIIYIKTKYLCELLKSHPEMNVNDFEVSITEH